MNGFDMENAFGQPPAEFKQGMEHALRQVKEEKTVKKFTARTLILAAALVLMLCGIALAVSSTYGVEWFLKERYADPPTLPKDFSNQVQSDIPQENVDGFADVIIQDAAYLNDQKYYPNSFQLTLSAVVKDLAKYEMHEEFSLNTDGDTSERNDVDWLWTDKGYGPILEMMADPAKQLVFFDSGEITMGTKDGFRMPMYSEDTFLDEDGTVRDYIIMTMNDLDPAWLKPYFDAQGTQEAKDFLAKGLENAQAYQAAKAKYTDENGLTTLVFSYAVWEYPDWQNSRHEGYVTFKVKLP